MKDLHSRWPHRWLSPKAKAYRSPIHGWGIISVKKIFKGEIISVHGGIIVPKADVLKYQKIMGHVGIRIDENFFICPSKREELKKSGAFNHSCNPNCGHSFGTHFIAIKDIKPKEELTIDLAINETFFKPFHCRCGSVKCRKVIRPIDWRKKDIQKRLKKYYSPWLRDDYISNQNLIQKKTPDHN